MDMGSFEGVEGDISEEFGGISRSEVDSSVVVGGSFVVDLVNGLLFEEFVIIEFEGILEEVISEGRISISEKSVSVFVLDDLVEIVDYIMVVGGRVELDMGFDVVENMLVLNLV